jgi:signal transduction histidine kinase
MIKEAVIVMFVITLCFGQVTESTKKLAQESEIFCASTASTKPTPQMLMDKVTEGCKLIEKEGKKAFSKFKGKGSNFIFAGTYIWINDLDGKMLMHPIKPGMENQPMIGLKDSNGKRFFVDMIAIAKEKGDGWVDYLWPKPGSTERSMKVSYVKKSVCDGVPVIVCCGVYDMTMEEINQQIKK